MQAMPWVWSTCEQAWWQLNKRSRIGEGIEGPSTHVGQGKTERQRPLEEILELPLEKRCELEG